MKIQLWKRRNPKQDKNNIYLRFRISQNKAKVESLRLWEWTIPKNKIEQEHNNNVKIACNEILRRAKDDLDNGRISAEPKKRDEHIFKNQFFKFSSINNSSAVYNFIRKHYEDLENINSNKITTDILLNIKKKIEIKIEEGKTKGSTASKYWNNFKSVLITLYDNKICEYPNVPGIVYKKEKIKRNVFNKTEIKKLEKTDIKKWKDLKTAFLFSCNTGAKLNVIEKLTWKEINRYNNKTYHYKIEINKKKFINTFSIETRKLLGKRKKDNDLIFKIPEKKSSRTKTFKKWIHDASVAEHKTFNDAVNTFAYNTYYQTKNIYKISAILGHDSIQKTKEIYEYMNELDYINNEMNIDDRSNKNKEVKTDKKLFKKGNLLSYRKDTL